MEISEIYEPQNTAKASGFAGQSMNFNNWVVPVTGYQSETQQDFGNLLTLPQTYNATLCVLQPPAPSCPFFPMSLWPCSSVLLAAAVPTAVLTLTAAPLLPFIIKFSLKQWRSWCHWRWGEVCHSNLSTASNQRGLKAPQTSFLQNWLGILPLYNWTWGKSGEIIAVWSHIALAGFCWCIWFLYLYLLTV